MLQTKIRDYKVISGDHVLVTASVNHPRGEKVNPNDVLLSLNSATDGRLVGVAGSFVQLADEPVRTVVQGVMSLSCDVMPFTENMEQNGFRALASNMYLDQDENIWSVEQSENGGKVCVRSNTVDNPEELQDLLSKCSSRIPAGNDPSYFEAVASAQPTIPNSGDFITFVHESATHFGVVLSSVFEEDTVNSYTGECVVLAADGSEAVQISEDQIVGNVGQVDYEDLPQEMASVSAGNVGKSQIEQVVDYYKKVFGHRPDFFKQLEQRIRQHAFC